MSRVHERRRIFAYLDGRLSERGHLVLMRHVADCPDCRAYLETVGQARRALHAMGASEPPVDFAVVGASLARAARPLASDPRHPRPSSRWTLAAAIAAGAAAIAAIAVIPGLVGDGTDRTGAAGGPGQGVAVVRTLLDERPVPGFFTMIGGGTVWRRGGIEWQDADLATSITEGTEVLTRSDGTASLQLAPLSGIRVEPSTRMTVTRITKDEVRVDLASGRISLDIHASSGPFDVLVATGSARVRTHGALLSVEATGDSTRVAVASGRARVYASMPSAGESWAIVEAHQVMTVDGEGRVPVGTGPSLEKDRDEIQRLKSIEFNLFAEKPEEGSSVTFAATDGTGGVGVSTGGKVAGAAPLTMLVPQGGTAALLTFPDGSTVTTPFEAGKAGGTVVSFRSPIVPAKTSLPAGAKPPFKSPAEPAVAGDVEVDQPEGFIEPSIVKIVIKAHVGKMRGCYQKFLAGNPSATLVKAKVSFTIGESGKVTAASTWTGAGDEKLETCISSVMKAVVFPPPEGGPVDFQYPITFAPQ